MSGIVELLKAFDRKERAWLVRMALKPATLDKGFLDRVSASLGLDPQLLYYAWWGMDYHIDWLAAALHAFEKGLSVEQLTGIKDLKIEGRSKPIIEDFDFIIANEEHIILIEAKAFESWSNEQLKRKFDRLARLPVDDAGWVTNSKAKVQLHLILTSINAPKRLEPLIPVWALRKDSKALKKDDEGRSPAWIKLDIEPGQFMRVARSDDAGIISEKGTLWKVAKDREIKKATESAAF